MFASQAALAIANARYHRDEQRARADPGGTGQAAVANAHPVFRWLRTSDEGRAVEDTVRRLLS